VCSYGFLSENIEFATAIEGAGIAFLGPTTATMEQFSLKHTARAIAQNAKVLPLLVCGGVGVRGMMTVLSSACNPAQ
jgi:acetyl/propionyl-CoA carboxylase alpha subunit